MNSTLVEVFADDSVDVLIINDTKQYINTCIKVT